MIFSVINTLCCQPDYSGNGVVVFETIPNIFNGGLWLGCAAFLLVMITIKKKQYRKRLLLEMTCAD